MLRGLMVGAVCLFAAVLGGCREPQSRAPTRPLPPPTPASLDLGEGQSLGAPIVHENLAIYPVRGSVSAEVAEYLTLDEALAQSVIEVRERDDATVNSVLVTNKASLPIYLMAGEVILGGKQDRVVAKDTVVPAGKRDVPVGVFCVEPHRWEGDTAAFKQSGLQASGAVRKAAQLDGDQQEVWSRVAEANAMAGAAPATGAYRAGASAGEVAKAAQAYADVIVPQLEADKEAIGVVVAIDGEVVSADVYGSQALFQKLKTKLVAAHARDAAASALQGHARRETPGGSAARQFLIEARRGTTVQEHKSGAAEMRQVEAEGALGFQTQVAPAAPGAAKSGQMLHENYYGDE